MNGSMISNPTSCRRIKGETARIASAMKDDPPLDRAGVEDYKNQLSRLSLDHVEKAYRDAHSACCPARGLPTAAQIQRLLCAWKVLWQWKQNEQPHGKKGQ